MKKTLVNFLAGLTIFCVYPNSLEQIITPAYAKKSKPSPKLQLDDFLGIKITGKYTQQDLATLKTAMENYHLRSKNNGIPWLFQGLKEIHFNPQLAKEGTGGQADYNNGIIELNPPYNTPTFYHELTHFAVKRILGNFPAPMVGGILLSWTEDYHKYSQYCQAKNLPHQKNKFGYYIAYCDRTAGLRHGFVRPYGATNYQEDIATFMELILTNPKEFQKVHDSFETYSTKIDQLMLMLLISENERNTLLGYLPTRGNDIFP